MRFRVHATLATLIAAAAAYLGGTQQLKLTHHVQPAVKTLPKSAPSVGIDNAERASGAAERRARQARLVAQHDREARQELRQGYRALLLLGERRQGGQTVFLPPKLIAHRLDRYSLHHFAKLSDLGFFLVPRRPKPGFWGDGDMNALQIDRDSTPEHVVFYQGTEDYKVYELDAYPGREPVVFNPYAKKATVHDAKSAQGFSLPRALLFALVALIDYWGFCSILSIFSLTPLKRLKRLGTPLVSLALARRRRQAAKAALLSWREKVESGQGPEAPREGYRLLEARWSRERQGQDVQISFQADELAFKDGRWQLVQAFAAHPSKVRQRWSAAEPMAEIVSAWVEFAADVARENARRYEVTLDAGLRAELEAQRELEESYELAERWRLPELLPEAKEAVRGLSL